MALRWVETYPSGHAVHAVALAVANLPATHGWQASRAGLGTEPGAQRSHAVALRWVETYPSGHAVHAVARGIPKVPGKQLEQATRAAVGMVPGVQASHTVAPGLSENVVGSQRVQVEAPYPLAYVPGAHLSHTLSKR